MKTKKLLLVVFLLFFVIRLFGGWIVETEKSNQDGSEQGEVIYIQDNKMKMVGEETIIFDLEQQEMIVINDEKEEYFSGNPAELFGDIQKTMKSIMEEKMKNLPPEQQEMLKKMQEQMDAEAMTMEPAEEKVKIEIKETSETDQIAGYSAKKYQIWSDNVLKEELWIAKDIAVKDEIDIDLLIQFMKDIQLPGGDSVYSSAEEYVGLMKKGFPLKTVEYRMGDREYSEAVRIEKKKIPASEFEVPVGYQKVEMKDIMGE